MVPEHGHGMNDSIDDRPQELLIKSRAQWSGGEIIEQFADHILHVRKGRVYFCNVQHRGNQLRLWFSQACDGSDRLLHYSVEDDGPVFVVLDTVADRNHSAEPVFGENVSQELKYIDESINYP